MLSCFVLNCSTHSPKISQNFSKIEVSENAININIASTEELQKLPYVGEKTAEKIIEHRQRFGKFRRPEHLMLVGGISDKRFRNMRNMVKVD